MIKAPNLAMSGMYCFTKLPFFKTVAGRDSMACMSMALGAVSPFSGVNMCLRTFGVTKGGGGVNVSFIQQQSVSLRLKRQQLPALVNALC